MKTMLRRQTVMLSEQDRKDLAARARSGDLEARQIMIEANIPLAISIAIKYRGGILEDRIQEATVGLIHAVDRFDPDRAVNFSTYAAWWIKAMLIHYVREDPSVVTSGLHGNGKQDPHTIRKVQADVAIGPEEIAFLESQSDITTPEDHVIKSEIAAKVKTLIGTKKLSPREIDLINMRLLAADPCTLNDLGEKWGTCRELARLVESKLKKKIARRLAPLRGEI